MAEAEELLAAKEKVEEEAPEAIEEAEEAEPEAPAAPGFGPSPFRREVVGSWFQAREAALLGANA